MADAITANQDIFGQGSTASSGTIENPKGQLNNEDFLHLFLEELKNQDPTEPMDNNKILDQTAQLASIEANEALKVSLEAMASSTAQSTQFTATSMIGRAAKISDDNNINVVSGNSEKFGVYIDEVATNIKIEIKDKDYNTVYEETMTYQNALADGTTEDVNIIAQGYLPIEWEGKTNDGVGVSDGEYSIVTTYQTVDGAGKAIGETKNANVSHKIESVRFTKDGAELNIGNKYVSMTSIKELY